MKKKIMLLATILILSGCSFNSPDVKESAEVPVSSTNAVSGETIAWGFVRTKNEAPKVPEEWSQLLKQYDGYYLGNSDEKKVYLTFDEGYENGYTSKILDVLESTGTKAIFFVTAPYLEGQPELIKRMIDDGHYIGNHTVNHPNLSQCSEEEIKNELGALRAKCEELYGVSMQYMRPPEGSFNENVLRVAKEMGFKTVLWSHAYKDWDVDMQKGVDYAINQVVPYTHNGEILLLHAVSKDNADALEEIIKQIKDMGYEFADPAEL